MKALLAAVVTVVALLAGSCGGAEANEPPVVEPVPRAGYVETLEEAFTPVLEATGGLADVSGLDELDAALARLEGAASEAEERLRAADPPEEVAEAHSRLLSGFEVLADRAAGARAALTAAREGDLGELPALLEAGSALGLEEIQDALEELRKLGFETDRIGG